MQKNQYEQVITIAQAAGDKIMEVYQRDFAIEQKADQSPLTEADLAAHSLIEKGLQELGEVLPVLSEESGDITWAERQQWSEYWLVDPLDGTKEFIKKNDEFTVNIAHIVNGAPVWGVVVAPALGVTYHGGTAVENSYKRSPNDIEMQVAELPSGTADWCIVGSRSHQSDAFVEFVSRFQTPSITSMGSSLKICLVAEGKAHLYPRLGPTSEWDTGAAHAVLLGAGGKVVDLDSNQPLLYNQEENILNPYFLATPQEYKT
ncbi:3'(2'),5'-bisphosphate nucleotidase CysQ [Gilvimarinus sp. 1_MG-2023]|uniref:3'(2'),5'-bisphosphate nucleotidase CysQ n=1 Tax=Gilvimarinus sp. 1_MG-2023 TaxID=3062638 RepID=UPI0026E32106|nr:3'(2'),5'-bisphosphate nucleotidase CysQ [Gilvimarinus sp. 1_MG-2023]MDO6746938.1 3'(2'),5'-bisphosphate nucleotidase CysQ [Gilvimarinus sp. 1_MG-2023]